MNLRDIITNFQNGKILYKSLIREAIENEEDINVVKSFMDILDSIISKIDSTVYRELKEIVDRKISRMASTLIDSDTLPEQIQEIKRFKAFDTDFSSRDGIKKNEYIRYVDKDETSIIRLYEAYPGEFINSINTLGLNKLSNENLDNYFIKRNRLLNIEDAKRYVEAMNSNEEIKSTVIKEIETVNHYFEGNVSITKDFLGNRIYIVGTKLIAFKNDLYGKRVLVDITNNNQEIMLEEIKEERKVVKEFSSPNEIIEKYLLGEELTQKEKTIIEAYGLDGIREFNKQGYLNKNSDYYFIENYLLYLRNKADRSEEEDQALGTYESNISKAKELASSAKKLALTNNGMDDMHDIPYSIMTSQDDLRAGFSRAIIIVGTVLIIGAIIAVLLLTK